MRPGTSRRGATKHLLVALDDGAAPGDDMVTGLGSIEAKNFLAAY